MKIEKSVDIAAPPQKIWPYLIEPDKMVQWCITFRKCEFTGEQHSGEGTRYYVEEKAGGPLMKIHFMVTKWTENQKLAFKMTSGNFVKGYELRWMIEPLAAGSRFHFAEDFTMPWGIIGRLIGFVGRSSSEKHVTEMLDKLKNLAESQEKRPA